MIDGGDDDHSDGDDTAGNDEDVDAMSIIDGGDGNSDDVDTYDDGDDGCV